MNWKAGWVVLNSSPKYWQNSLTKPFWQKIFWILISIFKINFKKCSNITAITTFTPNNLTFSLKLEAKGFSPKKIHKKNLKLEFSWLKMFLNCMACLVNSLNTNTKIILPLCKLLWMNTKNTWWKSLSVLKNTFVKIGPSSKSSQSFCLLESAAADNFQCCTRLILLERMTCAFSWKTALSQFWI